MTFTTRKIDDSNVEATVELVKSDLQGYVQKAEVLLAQEVQIDGFRKGKVPLEIARQHMNEAIVREEALRMAIQESLAEVVRTENIDVLDQKDFSIKENAPDKLRYVVTLVRYPRITLGTYAGIAVKKRAISEITDEEVKKVLDDFIASRATPESKPEVTDEMKQQLREGMRAEKEEHEHERIRLEIINSIIENSVITMPVEMIERQLDIMIQNFDRQLHEHNMELGPYLAHVKKTQDELRNDWRSQAEHQVKMNLALHAVAKAEKIDISHDGAQKIFDFLESSAVIS